MATHEQYLTFRRFNDREEANAFSDELIGQGFHAVYERDAPIQDPLLVGNGMTWHLVRLPREEFESAERVLLERAGEEHVDIPAEHYLHEFSDQELLEVVVKPDEWSADDVVMSRILLRQRGRLVSTEAVELLRTVRTQKLQEKEPSPRIFIVVGYVFAFLGGVVGLMIGWHINTSKTTLPNGERVPVYEAKDRKHGARIFMFGAIATLFWLVVRIWSWFA